MKPRRLIQQRVFPYFGNVRLQADWFINTPRLFFYYPNPWFKKLTSCRFSYDHKVLNYKLIWHKISTQHEFSLRQLASYTCHPVTQVSAFMKNSIWLSLATFLPQSKSQRQRLKNVVAEADNWRQKKTIIIDVRGNTGGNLFWGTEVLRALYGKAYFQQQLRTVAELVYQWRVSAGNIAELSGFYLQYAEKNFGMKSPATKWLQNTVNGMQAALENKQAYFPKKVVPSQLFSIATHFDNPVKAKIYLLTDGRCASSCLTFVDQ